MGNYMCVSMSYKHQQVQDEWQGPPTKVIRPDGTIEVFRKTVTVGELMNQHPDHSVCHSSAMMSPLTTASALPTDKELEGGRLYYVLHADKFRQEGKGASSGRKKLTLEITTIPGFAQVTVKGQGVVSNHGGVGKEIDDEEAMLSYSTPDLRSLYLSSRSQPSLTRSNSWKPRLETINEVGASSRRHIHNFMRARSFRRSQVHNI